MDSLKSRQLVSYRKSFLVVLLLVLAGCRTAGYQLCPAHVFRAERYSGRQPWRGERFNNDRESFQFIIMADRNGGNRPDVFERAVQQINWLQPEFVMSVGDYITGYTENDSALDAQWREFFEKIVPLQMPFFCLPGNHDISNRRMEQAWRDRLGPTWYHFIYANVLFICLNTEDPADHLSDAQINYVREVLEKNSKVRWTLVFMHKPLWKYDHPGGYEKIEPLLANRPYTVFAGHEHVYEKKVRQGINHYVLATTGGFSALRGISFGEFDHLMWVTMTDQGPVIANLEVGGILDDAVERAVP